MDFSELGPPEQALRLMSQPGARVCFSQFGEDLVIEQLVGVLGLPPAGGFYVDVGAFDPVLHSNTCLLHLRGWRGVNIDGNPAAVARFAQARPADRNVHAVVSDAADMVEFAVFAQEAISTADPGAKAAYEREGRADIRHTIVMQPRPLRHILAETVPEGQAIHVMSVDVEGSDLAALRSNDWQRFAPAVLLVEDPGIALGAPETEVYRFVTAQGYRLHSKTCITSVYVRDRPARA